MNKIIIALAIVLAILVGLLVYFMVSENNDAKEEPVATTAATEKVTEETEATELTEAPTQTDAPETEATVQTEPPAPETEATETTEEPTETTEEPTETEAKPDDEATKSGQFTSNTGTGLELIVDWQTYTTSDGTKMVRFDVSVACYSINVGSRLNGVHITMDGVTSSFDSVGVSSSSGRNTFQLASCTLEMAGDSANVNVTWDFRGSYSGKQMAQVTASGTVTR